MTYFLRDDSPRKAGAVAFGRELTKAIGVRGIPRNELWRATGIGRTALDNYRTGSSLPRTEAAAALAAVLDWPKLREIVATARTLACRRCKRSFTIEVGSGAKRYCSIACREVAAQEKVAGTRARQAGQTGDDIGSSLGSPFEPILLPPDQAGELLSVSGSIMRRLAKEGRAPTVWMRGEPYFVREALEDWIWEMSNDAGHTLSFPPPPLWNEEPDPPKAPKPYQRKDGRWSVRIECSDGKLRRFVSRDHEPVQAEHQRSRIPRYPLSATTRFAVLRRDNYTCRYCGRRPPEVALEIDHVLPVADGGTDDQANLVTACSECNVGKGRRLAPSPPVPA